MKRESQLDDGPGKFLAGFFIACFLAFWPFFLSGHGRIVAIVLWYGSILAIIVIIGALRDEKPHPMTAPPRKAVPPGPAPLPDLRKSDVFEGIR